ncbi:MAG: T9SS type A sorting domain-containing protein [Bacteroidia bacterium]
MRYANFLLVGLLYAQANYTFTSQTGTFNPITGTTLTSLTGVDDGYASFSLPFPFQVGCTQYPQGTNVWVSTNGWVTFGVDPGVSFLTNDLDNGNPLPAIAPLWDDLQAGTISYQVSGTAPNRILTIQWLNVEWNFGANNAVISFQVKLYESSNRIEFIYRREAGAVNSGSASIGLSYNTPTCTRRFYSLGNTSANPPVSTTTETNNLDAKPATGQIYRWDLNVISCTPPPSCTALLGSGVVNVPALPYSSGTSTTCGTVNDLTSSNTVSCGSTNYLGGQDRVYVFTPTTSGSVTATLSGADTWSGLKIYRGCPSACASSPGTCVAEGTGDNITLCFSVVAGETYYAVLDVFPAPNCYPYTNFTLSAPDPGLSHDEPCNALPVSLGTTISGTNQCASGKPPAWPGACGGADPLHTVWYSVVAPSSGQLRIRVIPESLTDPTVAVYSGTCNALTYVNCNDDAALNCSDEEYAADLTLTGLIPGATYYIRIDGQGSNQGTFTLTVIDPATQSLPPLPGQDCINSLTNGALPVCGSLISVGTPGFQGYGNYCNLPYPAGGCPGSCLTSGEKNVVVYNIPINANGTLEFSITPNPNVDIDFALYRVDNLTDPCTAIRNGTADPVRCSYAAPTSCDGTHATGIGVVGCASGNCEGAGGNGFLNALSVSAGQRYLLFISNFSGNPAGFTLNFGSSPITYTSATPTWTGGTSTAWNNATNWGGCAFPNGCTADAFIFGGPANQPVIAAGQTFTVRNLTIGTGATLTLQSGATLNICGNLVNNGTIVAQPGSNIVFTGNANQIIQGDFSVANPLANVRINKAGGTVRLQTAVFTVGGHFTMPASNVGTFSLNGNEMRLGGDFDRQGGTFNGNGLLTFIDPIKVNPTPAFTSFTHAGGPLTLHRVAIDRTPTIPVSQNASVYVTQDLTLTNGIFQTNAQEIYVQNNAPTSVVGGNANSFVRGNLRRAVTGTSTYNFPVGATTYQRATIQFTTGADMHNLLTRFDLWGGPPPTPPNPTAECGAQYHTCPLLNNGFWTITAHDNAFNTVPSNATYTLTLHNTNYTGCSGVAQYGILKNTGGGWFIQNPGCHANASPATVQRPGMSGFSQFATGQSTSPLPIVIHFFEGQITPQQAHLLKWEVADTEKDLSRVTLEVSRDATFWQTLATNLPPASQYLNSKPWAGMNFYRLHLQDSQGHAAYSHIVALTYEPDNAFSILQAFPNPANETFTIRYHTLHSGPILLCLYNELGQKVYQATYSPTGEIILDVSRSAKGIYLIQLIQQKTPKGYPLRPLRIHLCVSLRFHS